MSLIKKPSEAVDVTTVLALIYGPPGVGKTTYGLSAPRPLLIDTDNGIRRVSPKDRRPYVEVRSWADVVNVLKEDLSDFDSLVVDTAGRALDWLIADIIRENPNLSYLGSLNQKGFGVLKNRFGDFLRLVRALRKNLVFIAHDKESRSEDGPAVYRPDVIGGSLANLVRDMDLVGYMYTVPGVNATDAPIRSISFEATDRHYGKNTAGLPSVIKTADLSISDLFGLFRKKEDERLETAKVYDKAIEEISTLVSSITSPETAKEVGDKIASATEIWDSKLIARKLFRDKIVSLGIEYSSGAYRYKADQPAPVEDKVSDRPTPVEDKVSDRPTPGTAETIPGVVNETSPLEKIKVEKWKIEDEIGTLHKLKEGAKGKAKTEIQEKIVALSSRYDALLEEEESIISNLKTSGSDA